MCTFDQFLDKAGFEEFPDNVLSLRKELAFTPIEIGI